MILRHHKTETAQQEFQTLSQKFMFRNSPNFWTETQAKHLKIHLNKFRYFHKLSHLILMFQTKLAVKRVIIINGA